MPRAGRVALAVAGGLILLFVAAQLALPPIAEHRLRDRLERSGTVERVEISAFPAVKLLWHRADDVTVRMGRLRTGSGNFADLLVRTVDTHDLDASAEEQRILTLRLHDSPSAVTTVLFGLGDGIAMRMLIEPDRDFSETLRAGIACARALLTDEG